MCKVGSNSPYESVAAYAGNQANKAASGSRALDTAQPVEQFAKPIVMMASAAGVYWATPASTVLFAGQQLHWSSAGDLHLAVAYTVSSVAANALSLNTHAGGIKAIAGNGPVSLQAHTGELEIVADKAVTVISVNDSIAINAQQKIVLQAGQSSITLDGGDITFACPGNFTVKGGQHVFDGGASVPAPLAQLPEGALPPDTLYLDHRYHDDRPLAGADYFVTFANGSKLDGQGRAVLAGVPAGVAQVSYGPMPGAFERFDKTPTPDYAAVPSNAKIDSLFDKYLDAGAAGGKEGAT